MASKKLLKGEGTLGHDCFIAGACLLPGAFLALVTAILGEGNLEVIIALGVVFVCLMILMLFSGFTRIYKIKESLATSAVPMTLLVCCWISKVIYTAMFNHF
jgi:VIT1/CCC1 family predicted Fe2+/Mn2+ transporter